MVSPQFAAFTSLLCARAFSALYLHITDCDETFNYWEPMHYLLQGEGLQTWEYSPEYGLRSYLYLIIHSIPAWICKHVTEANTATMFYATRCVFAIICAVLETVLFSAIRYLFGTHASTIWIIFQAVSPGMYISSTAFLPSTFSMYMTMAFLTAWWYKKYKLAILSIVITSFVGWPFAALICFPFLYEVLIQRRMFKFFIKWSIFFAVLVGLPILMVDSYFYGKTTFAPLNLILYNVFSSHGPNLFGIESKYFYFINLFLNFNIAWCFALSFPITAIVVTLKKPPKLPTTSFGSASLWKTLSLYIWILVFFVQPHKEERFIFPVYPLVSLCAALGALNCINWLSRRINISFQTVVIGVISCYAALSVSRIAALYLNYYAPMDITSSLEESSIAKNICYGKEWHRSPGNFLLPPNYRLRFIKSSFNGILPAYYQESNNATSVVHEYFNDENLASAYMLFNYSMCDYLVDLDLGDEYNPNDLEPNHSSDSQNWEIIKTIRFLDSNRSCQLFRAFYIPFISSSRIRFGNYNLLKRKPQTL
ncbi:alpha-1,2-mannosyltransferase ALG9-like isoform X1 [Sabethes cyaneus]|uniref:alpha-1,2-mannosyltransferase ALG9-like isoform X1 n=1 Tax=Sabethes cyaneus TaxID=53552 RepID=UPI00237EBC5D|nr:alpha-1,2-mannosyltransferase ALG9-like isoform X1 [Sabethes cyaneus]